MKKENSLRNIGIREPQERQKMNKNDIMQHLIVGRSKAIIIEQKRSKEYPGYVRTITIMRENIVRIEFEEYGWDEGGITYYVQFDTIEKLIESLEEYLGKTIENWDNINKTGTYPEENNDDESVNKTLSDKKIIEDMLSDKIKLPKNGNHTWMPNGYWKELKYRSVNK